MPPRTRRTRKPAAVAAPAVVAEEILDDVLEDETPSPAPTPLAVLPDPEAPDESSELPVENPLLRLIRLELGVELDDNTLEMCLAVAEFVKRSRKATVSIDDNEPDYIVEDDDELLEEEEEDEEDDELMDEEVELDEDLEEM